MADRNRLESGRWVRPAAGSNPAPSARLDEHAFGLDRPTALYNAGLWLVAVGVLTMLAIAIGGTAGWVIGAAALAAGAVAVRIAVRPPWVVRVGADLRVRGRARRVVQWEQVRRVAWEQGVLTVHTDGGAIALPTVDHPEWLERTILGVLISESSRD